jgi:hypothetical protein
MRPNNRGGMRHPGLGNNTLRNRMKRTDVPGWLKIGGATSNTWPSPRPEPGIFPRFFFLNSYDTL